MTLLRLINLFRGLAPGLARSTVTLSFISRWDEHNVFVMWKLRREQGNNMHFAATICYSFALDVLAMLITLFFEPGDDLDNLCLATETAPIYLL